MLSEYLFSGKATLLFSTELIDEINSTIAKPKLQKYFKQNALEEMLSVFEPFTELITVEGKLAVCRDPKDNFLLALAKDGRADYLLTGDYDLLDLKKLGKTKL